MGPPWKLEHVRLDGVLCILFIFRARFLGGSQSEGERDLLWPGWLDRKIPAHLDAVQLFLSALRTEPVTLCPRVHWPDLCVVKPNLTFPTLLVVTYGIYERQKEDCETFSRQEYNARRCCCEFTISASIILNNCNINFDFFSPICLLRVSDMNVYTCP